MRRPCTLWRGARRGRYGVTWRDGKMESAHRVSWERHYGSIPSGMVVMHVCDEPLCVERTHLRLGTQRDNLADRDAKGRQAKGERHGSSRLTEDFVRRVRWAASRGLTQQQIADILEISNQSVSNILTGKTWSHVR